MQIQPRPCSFCTISKRSSFSTILPMTISKFVKSFGYNIFTVVTVGKNVVTIIAHIIPTSYTANNDVISDRNNHINDASETIKIT